MVICTPLLFQPLCFRSVRTPHSQHAVQAPQQDKHACKGRRTPPNATLTPQKTRHPVGNSISQQHMQRTMLLLRPPQRQKRKTTRCSRTDWQAALGSAAVAIRMTRHSQPHLTQQTRQIQRQDNKTPPRSLHPHPSPPRPHRTSASIIPLA
jgi:hypothetical protein